jgi:DNA-binding transcriptional ArsR family regulator
MSRPRNSESVFRAIADPTRRKMLDLLRDGERSVGEMVTTMRLQRAVASHHLGVLIQAGLIRQRRRGRELVCAIESRPLARHRRG